MFGETFGGKGYSGGLERDWMKHLDDGLKAFAITFKMWHGATQKAGEWFRRDEEVAEVFTRKWNKDENE